MASVGIRDVRKAFGATEVIHGVNIDIEDGAFVVLVGPSGCGKSTLLRMIAGLENITGGEIKIGERVVNDLPPKARDIAMVFQNYALYPHMTVAANMALLDEAAHTPRVRRSTSASSARPKFSASYRCWSAFRASSPAGSASAWPWARAIVRDPQVFLFDEPLSNLDAKLRVAMRTEIKELHQRLGTTTVYVTHDQIEAMTMADKIVVMHDGLVEQIGAPLELYDRPDNLFVAGFIGSPAMNFFKGRISPNGSAAFETADGVKLPISRRALALRRPAGHLRHSARAFPARRRRRPGRGGGDRADWLRNPGRGPARHHGNRCRIPRTSYAQARRKDPAAARARSSHTCSTKRPASGWPREREGTTTASNSKSDTSGRRPRSVQ